LRQFPLNRPHPTPPRSDTLASLRSALARPIRQHDPDFSAVLALLLRKDFHDTANAVATAIYTHSLPAHFAVVMSSSGYWTTRRASPFAAALARYDREREYSWAAPGHQAGVAFLRSAVGRAFFDFYGENLFRTDVGI